MRKLSVAQWLSSTRTYPLPNMMVFSTRVEGCTLQYDLRKGYHQIPMHPADIPKMAIITPFGLFEILRLTVGLRNAGSTFQLLMDRVYLDNITLANTRGMWRKFFAASAQKGEVRVRHS